MFDFGAIEILLIVIVAVVVIGPKDMPLAMRHAGRWIGQMRKLSGHFRAGLDAMVREAELEDMEKQWAEKNAKIMKEHPPEAASASAEAKGAEEGAAMEPLAASAEAAKPVGKGTPADPPTAPDAAEKT